MQEFIVNVYVSLIILRRNNYQDFALPLYPKAVPLTPTLIYWKQYKVYIT